MVIKSLSPLHGAGVGMLLLLHFYVEVTYRVAASGRVDALPRANIMKSFAKT
jgi:hypothetical protein